MNESNVGVSPGVGTEPAKAAADAPATPRRGGGQLVSNSPLAAFLPNRVVSRPVMLGIILFQIAAAFALWTFSPYKVLPRPGEVLTALQDLWATQGLIPELFTSFLLNVKALLWATLISLTLSYLTVLPFFRPLVNALSKGRFLSMAGFTLVFTLVFQTGARIQVALLTFSMTVFFLTSMAAVIAGIPKADFDHARTLRMSEWRVVWEVVVLGTLDKAFEVMRQNAAIGWTLLTFVEGLVRANGGVGVLLANQGKYLNYAAIYGIQLCILLLGLFQDYVLGLLRKICCPYADLTLERKEG
jgi:NitT/TauT family transport system permease protein